MRHKKRTLHNTRVRHQTIFAPYLNRNAKTFETHLNSWRIVVVAALISKRRSVFQLDTKARNFQYMKLLNIFYKFFSSSICFINENFQIFPFL